MLVFEGPNLPHIGLLVNRRTQMHSASRASIAACAIALALVLVFVHAAVAWADDGPHVSPTADTASCAACHRTHAQTQAVLTGLGVVADNNPSAVCLGCHSVKGAPGADIAGDPRDSFALASGHSLMTPSTRRMQLTGCSACHDSHGSSAVTPMIPSATINDVTVTTSGPAACMACHDGRDSWYGTGYPSTSAPARDASGYPVSGTWTGPETYESSANAHRLIPETTQTVSADHEVKRQKGDCLYCHAAHRGANKYDGLLTTYTVPAQSTLEADREDGAFAALCFTCHGGAKPSGFAKAPIDIKRFVIATAGPPAGGGHAITTAGGSLPVGSPLPCFECHNPHGSKRGNSSLLSDELGGSLETSTAAGVRRFCFTCHTTNDTAAGWDSDLGQYVAVTSTSTVVGLLRASNALRLSTHSGHNASDFESCYDCHGNGYDTGGRNVHDPQADGRLLLASATTTDVVPAGDTVPPLTSADLAAQHSGIVTLVATDTGSGIAETLYSLDGGVLTSGTVVSASGEGTHTVQFWSVDKASNVETPTIAEFDVDETAPVTTCDALATYTDTAEITLTAQDDPGGTGVAATYYRLDAADVATYTVVATSTAGSHTLDFWSVDNAGNVESTQTVDFTIAPAGAIPAAPPPAALDGTRSSLDASGVLFLDVGHPDVRRAEPIA